MLIDHSQLDDPADALRLAGLRVTQQRTAILRLLSAHPHATADDLHRHLGVRGTRVPLPTVHMVLHDLVAADLVRKISIAGPTSARYEILTENKHHHMQCVVCHRIEDVACTTHDGPCLTPTPTHGMRVLEASVTFHAICQQCERNADV